MAATYTILVCDDEKEITDAIEIYLTQEGYEVRNAYDAPQALSVLEKELEHAKPVVRILINAAGFGKIGNYGSVGIRESNLMIGLNCRAAVDLTYLCLPFMERGSRILQKLWKEFRIMPAIALPDKKLAIQDHSMTRKCIPVCAEIHFICIKSVCLPI